MKSLLIVTILCTSMLYVFAQDYIDEDYDYYVPVPFDPETLPEEDIYNPDPIPIVDRRRRQSNDVIDICNRENCRNRGNGVRALEPCGQAFCSCVNGYSYLQGCGQGLVFDTQRRVCNFPYAVAAC